MSSILRHTVAAATAIALLAQGLPSVALSAPPRPPKTVETSGLEFITPETQKAIDNGLAFLAGKQDVYGAFGSTIQYRRNVAITSLAGMAFLSAGHTPVRGKYGATVQKTLDFILARCQPSGFIADEEERYHG